LASWRKQRGGNFQVDFRREGIQKNPEKLQGRGTDLRFPAVS